MNMQPTDPMTQLKPRVVRGRAELFVPYKNNEITFIYPSLGPNTYQEVGKEILQKRLILPHGDYTAALLHATYCSDAQNEPEFANVREIMNKRWLWVFNQNFWTDKGVYVLQDTNAERRTPSVSIKNLEEKLKGGIEIDGVRFSEDGTVRFAPKETYSFGVHPVDSFAKDGFVRATAGIEGSQKLAEVSEQFNYKPHTLGVTIAQDSEAEQRVSALVEYDGRLRVAGDYFDDLTYGHAFGVSS